MSKIKTIIGLLLFIIILFLIDMIFGNKIMETFRGGVVVSSPGPGFSPRIINPIATRRYVNVPRYIIDADDSPLNYGFM